MRVRNRNYVLVSIGFKAEGIRKQWPPKAKRLASELEGLGAMRSFQLIGKEANGPIQTYRYRALFPKDSLLFSVSFDKEQHVVHLNVEFE